MTSSETKGWILTAAMGYGIYIIGKSLLEKLNVVDTAEEEQTKDTSTKPSGSGGSNVLKNGNPFDPNLWLLQQKKLSPKKIAVMTLTYTNASAKRLYEELNNKLQYTEADKLLAEFKALSSKSKVSYLCYIYKKNYGKDLYSQLSSKWTNYDPFGQYSKTDFQNITTWCNNLLEYSLIK